MYVTKSRFERPPVSPGVVFTGKYSETEYICTGYAHWDREQGIWLVPCEYLNMEDSPTIQMPGTSVVRHLTTTK